MAGSQFEKLMAFSVLNVSMRLVPSTISGYSKPLYLYQKKIFAAPFKMSVEITSFAKISNFPILANV